MNNILYDIDKNISSLDLILDRHEAKTIEQCDAALDKCNKKLAEKNIKKCDIQFVTEIMDELLDKRLKF